MKCKILKFSLIAFILIGFSACNPKTNLSANDNCQRIETLIKDLDNDGKMDSVFLYQNKDSIQFQIKDNYLLLF